MSLFGMLGSTARALDAQRHGLDVVGQNIANVNTAGYTRRTIDFASVPPVDRFSAGSGVNVLSVRAQRDRLYDQRLFDERPLERREAAIVDALGLVEVSLGRPGSSLDAALDNFFDGLAELAEAPVSVTARQRVLSEAGALASTFQSLAYRLDEAARATDQRVRADVERVNTLSNELASLNGAVARSPQEQALHLRDRQVATATELAGLLGVHVLELEDGTFQVAIDSGRPLVIGTEAYALTVSDQPPTGHAAILSGGVDITSAIRIGSIGGLLVVRDTLIPGYRQQLDTMAHDVATAVNAAHATGFDPSGAPGGNFFVPPAGVAGAARTLTVDAALLADPGRLAAAGVPASGDNGVARQLADLRDAPIVAGSSPADAWTGLVFRVASDMNGASRELASRREVVHQIELLRDSVSGVSIDEEAALMMRFQRAYEANARFFTVIDEVLQTLFSLKR